MNGGREFHSRSHRDKWVGVCVFSVSISNLIAKESYMFENGVFRVIKTLGVIIDSEGEPRLELDVPVLGTTICWKFLEFIR